MNIPNICIHEIVQKDWGKYACKKCGKPFEEGK